MKRVSCGYRLYYLFVSWVCSFVGVGREERFGGCIRLFSNPFTSNQKSSGSVKLLKEINLNIFFLKVKQPKKFFFEIRQARSYSDPENTLFLTLVYYVLNCVIFVPSHLEDWEKEKIQRFLFVFLSSLQVSHPL